MTNRQTVGQTML